MSTRLNNVCVNIWIKNMNRFCEKVNINTASKWSKLCRNATNLCFKADH